MTKFIAPLFASLMLMACAHQPSSSCACPHHQSGGKAAVCDCRHECKECKQCGEGCKGKQHGKICHEKAGN